jgi:hypothetical protein
MRSVAGAWRQRQEGAVDDYSWIRDLGAVDMDELSSLYRIAPLGDKPPEALATVFGNSMFMCFVYAATSSSAPGGSWPMASTVPTSPTWLSTRTTKDAGSGRR